MNRIEAQTISKFIGISEHEVDSFQSFFEYIQKIKFPKEIKRYLNSDKTKVIYKN